MLPTITQLTILVLIILIICIALKIYSRFCCTWCRSNACLVGKTALITGGSLGIGHEIVLNLASRGCKVIVADKVIDDAIKDVVKNETNSSNVRFEYVDFGCFDSVRKFAERIRMKEVKLDILVHNAGIGHSMEKTVDGLNLLMQVNYYSAFLLTHLLLDILKKSPAARIIFTSSYAAYLSPSSIEETPSKHNCINYSRSKLYMLLIADIFSEKLQKYNITCNSYQPGIARTRIINNFKNITILDSLFVLVLKLGVLVIGKSPVEGAQTAIHLACSNEVKGVTGKFFGETTQMIKPLPAYNQKSKDTLWSLSEKIVKLEPQEVLKQ